MRVIFAIAILFASLLTGACDLARWVEVRGSAWHPQSTVLPGLEAVLRPAVLDASKNRGRTPKWTEYTFQYQGRTTLLGERYIYVNAFCGTSEVQITITWVTVMDGGACYFSVKYDPDANRVYDLVVNGVA